MIQEGVQYVIEAEISQAMSNFNSLASQLKKLGIDVDDTETEFMTLGQVLEEAGEESNQVEDGLDGLGEGLGNTGEEASNASSEVDKLASSLRSFMTISAIVATGKKVIDVFSSFETQMNSVQAVSGATEKTMLGLSIQAKELGASTNYSATEAGSAQEALLRLGYSAEEAMDSVAAVLSFDRANKVEDLAKSSEYLGSVTKLFGLEAKEATRVADAMSQTTRSSKTDVDYLASALNNAGSESRNFGYDIEDTLTLIGAMSNSFADGSSAGTALKGLFADFSSNKDKFEALGIAIADSNGEFRQTEDIVSDLNSVLADKTPVEQQKLLNQLFGETGRSAFNALAIATDSIGQLESNIRNANGVTESMAQLMDSGLGPKINGMMGSIETLAITIGERFNGSMITSVEGMTSLINTTTNLISNWEEVYDKNSLLIDGLTMLGVGMLTYTGITKGVAGYQALLTASTTSGTIANGIYTTSLAIKNAYMTAGGGITGILTAAQWALNAAYAANPIGAVVAGIAALVVGVRYAIKNFEWFRDGISFVWELMKKSPIGIVTTGIVNLISKIEPLEAIINKLAGGLKKLFGWKDEYSDEEIELAIKKEEEEKTLKEYSSQIEENATIDTYEEEVKKGITYEVGEVDYSQFEEIDREVNLDYKVKEIELDNLEDIEIEKGVNILGGEGWKENYLYSEEIKSSSISQEYFSETNTSYEEHKNLVNEESFVEENKQVIDERYKGERDRGIVIHSNVEINLMEGSREESKDILDQLIERVKREVEEGILSGARLAGVL